MTKEAESDKLPDNHTIRFIGAQDHHIIRCPSHQYEGVWIVQASEHQTISNSDTQMA